jgi:hypothetical protein
VKRLQPVDNLENAFDQQLPFSIVQFAQQEAAA